MRRTILLCAQVVCLVLAMSICGSARAQTDESEALSRRVKELFNAGKMDEAIPLAKRALSINEKALGSDHPAVATNLTELAKLYEAQGRYSEAEPLYMRALSIEEKALGPDRPDVVASLTNLARLYQAQGRYSDAEKLQRRSLEIVRKQQLEAAQQQRQAQQRAEQDRRASEQQAEAARRAQVEAQQRAQQEAARKAQIDAQQRAQEETARKREQADRGAYTSVPVYFGTDRKRGPDQLKDKLVLSTFGADRVDELILGEAIVTVPNEGRERGTIPRPSWSIFRIEKEDLAKHFTLRGVNVLSEDKFVQTIKKQMEASNAFKDQALLFVHGYAMTFENSLYRTAQIAFDLDFDGVPFLFSWPSKGDFRGYRADLDRANGSKIHLREFLDLIVEQSGAKKIHIIAHSMGAGPLLEVLEALGKSTKTPRELRINEIILAAPDIDSKNFEKLAKRITPWAGGITLYASKNDVALKASKGLTLGDERAGFVGEKGPLIFNGVDTIDVSAISTNWFGWNHAEPMERRHLIKDIKRILETGTHPPDKRFDVLFERVTTPRGIYWKYVQ